MAHPCELQFKTCKEIADIFAADPVVFVPMGSTEEHGPHSPVGDYIIAYEIALEACKRTGAYCLPPIPFGYSEYFRGFPGTISLSARTLYHVIKDVCACLIEHGVTKIILLNGHGGNVGILEILGRDLRREHHLLVGKIDVWQSLPLHFMQELYGENIGKIGHGGEPVTSAMQYLHPELSRMELLEPWDREASWQAFTMDNLSRTKIGDTTCQLYFNMDEITRQGVMGDPYLGNPEIGKRIVDKIIGYCVEFADKMQQSDMRVQD